MTPEERAFAAAQIGPAEPAVSPRRRLSFMRLGVAFAVALAAVGSTLAFRYAVQHSPNPVVQSAFMPYVDVTATPEYAFENATRSSVVLGFVVSSRSDACSPSWGGSYSLPQADSALDVDRRIARFEQRGGQVAVSFGGAANSELAIGCSDATALTEAYRSVIDRYSVGTIDLDLESEAALSPAAVARRAQALHALQTQERTSGRTLRVWLTLPVDPSGLTAAGSAALAATLAAKVDVAGVNALTMDYGASRHVGQSLLAASESALTNTAAQVRHAYTAAGHSLTAVQAWQHLGATPMIGQNDTPDERLDPSAATALVRYAIANHLRRLSMWSLNRDQACGPNYADVTVVSVNCSGVAQRAGLFSDIFARFKAGKPLKLSGTPSSKSATPSSTSIVDNPATSPYAIWNPELPYQAGTKIVWHRNVYQAKWWTKGDTPDAPVSSTTQTPWTLIGPVLPGEHPQPTPTMAAGTYPAWAATSTYHAGDRVLYRGVGYQAKWWTHGDVPGIVVDDPGKTPWELITTK
jgi:chitinase